MPASSSFTEVFPECYSSALGKNHICSYEVEAHSVRGIKARDYLESNILGLWDQTEMEGNLSNIFYELCDLEQFNLSKLQKHHL